MSQIKTYVSSTLDPCMTSHGLTLSAITATSSDGSVVSIALSDGQATPSSSTVKQSTVADPTASMLYLLDRFAVSDMNLLR